jgi:hypothetical protein
MRRKGTTVNVNKEYFKAKNPSQDQTGGIIDMIHPELDSWE